MKFEEVNFNAEDTNLVREIIALGMASYREAFHKEDTNVDWHKLAALVSTGIAHCIIARDTTGRIVGYQLWEHVGSWVERGHTSARLQSIYMTPEARLGTGFARFFSWGRDHMKNVYKPTDIIVPVDTGSPMEDIVPRLGFTKAASIFKQSGWVD